MLEILGAITGFAGSVVPTIIKHLQDKADRKHEIQIMKLAVNMMAQKIGVMLLKE